MHHGEEKAEGDLISAYKYLVGGCQENGTVLFFMVPSNNRHKLEHRKFSLYIVYDSQ